MDVSLELGEAQVAAIALAVLSAALILFAILRLRQVRQSSTHSAAAAANPFATKLIELQDDLRQLMQDMTGRLDSRMQALQRLLREADSAIGELERLTAAVPGRDSVSPDSPVTTLDVSAADTTARAARPAAARTPTRPAKPDQIAQLDQPDPLADRFAHVYSLAESGLDAAAIATQTAMHRGEVELILGLRRKEMRVDRGRRPEPLHARQPIQEAKV
jgi:hypothetical protein